MEFRILEEQELNHAAGLSRYVFDQSLRPRMDFPETCPFVEEYLKPENLAQLRAEGKLVIWGAFEGEQMIGVSGLQADGMITMLYVLPQFTRRGCGAKLLKEMRLFAKEAWGMSRVTVNATPAWTSYYFNRQGFSFTSGKQEMRVPFINMYGDYHKLQIQTNRHVPGWGYAAAIGGCFLFGIIFCCVFMCFYLF